MSVLGNWRLSLKHLATLIPRRDFMFWGFAAIFPFLCLLLFPKLIMPAEVALLDLKVKLDSNFLNTDKDEEIVILGIDTETLAKFPHKWPWPATFWAEILQKLDQRYSPKAILVDVFFQEDSQNPEFVKILAAELARNGKTGLVGIFDETLSSIGTELKVFPPIKLLRSSSAFWGISQQPIDSDGIVRTFTLSDYRIDKKHIAFEYLNHFGKNPFNFGNYSGIGQFSAIFRYKSRENSAMTISLADAIEGSLPEEKIKNRLVLIGPNAPILHDYHQTPVGNLTGPELICNSIETLKSGRLQISRPKHFAHVVSVCLGIFVSLFCFSNCFKRPFVAVIVTGAIFFPSLFVYSFYPLIHPPIAAAMISFLLFSAINLLVIRFIEIGKIRDSIHEAEICGNIQQKFFPATGLKTLSGIEIEGKCIPFLYAGGDYYDFFELVSGDVFFILGDVSGHGISAGMITTAAKSIVSLHADKENFSIESLFHDLNLSIRRMLDRKIMMSAVAGIIMPEKKKIKIHSAGHLPAYLKTREGLREFPIPGLPLGVAKKRPDPGFVEIDLPEEGKLVLYSDGVIESVNWQNAMLGFDEFADSLQKLPHDLSARNTIDLILENLDKHTLGREFQDDVTILVINFAKEKTN